MCVCVCACILVLWLHAVPDLRIEGRLQAIHVMLDKPQLELIKGLVEMNLGETIEEFEKPSTVIRDPIAQVRVMFVYVIPLLRYVLCLCVCTVEPLYSGQGFFYFWGPSCTLYPTSRAQSCPLPLPLAYGR